MRKIAVVWKCGEKSGQATFLEIGEATRVGDASKPVPAVNCACQSDELQGAWRFRLVRSGNETDDMNDQPKRTPA